MFKLIRANVIFRKIPNMLMAIGVAISMALIVCMLLMQKEITSKFEQNSLGVDLIVGSKGSPLQLVLNTLFQMDVPVGNVSHQLFKSLENDSRVSQAIPICLGDQAKGFRVMGTSQQYFDVLSKDSSNPFSAGEKFQKNYEAVLGSVVAKRLNYSVGQKFLVSHGVDENQEIFHGPFLTESAEI